MPGAVSQGGSQLTEFIEYSVRADDTSDSGPTLSTIGGELYIGWTGENNHFVNIMPIVRLPDGQMYFDGERKAILSNRAGGGPALCPSEVAGEGALVWAVDNPQGELNGIIGATLNGNLNETRELVSFEWTDHSPAAELWVKEVNVAWTGSNNLQINCAPLTWEDSGWTFSSARKSISTETTPYEPALSWRPAPNRMYVGWTGEGDHELNLMYCQGLDWGTPQRRTDFDRGTKRTFAEYSDGGPAIRVQAATMIFLYRGSGNENLNLLRVDLDDGSVIAKNISGHLSSYRPAITGLDGVKYVAWTGLDDHLYVGRVARDMA